MDSFGTHLRHWRQTRKQSQLDLALSANVSARHVSFLETGRAKPSRPMILTLSNALDIPRQARNTMLAAAGFAAAYRSTPLDSQDMSAVSGAIKWTMERHDPYPAMVIDQLWRLVDANASATLMLTGFGVAAGDNMLDALLQNNLGPHLFENWAEVGALMARRLRTESAHSGGIPELDTYAGLLEADPDVAAYTPPVPVPAIIPARYRIGGTTLSFFTTLAQFGTAEDIALADLRIELMFPADDATKDWLAALSL